VDIFDVMTKQLLFRGQAQEAVSNNAEKNTKALYKATRRCSRTSRRCRRRNRPGTARPERRAAATD